jgi:hypothetical protein
MDESRIDRLEKELIELRGRLSGSEKPKKEKKPRAASEYNEFIKNHIAEQKQKLGSDYNHKEAFKSGAAAWSKTKKPC